MQVKKVRLFVCEKFSISNRIKTRLIINHPLYWWSLLRISPALIYSPLRRRAGDTSNNWLHRSKSQIACNLAKSSIMRVWGLLSTTRTHRRVLVRQSAALFQYVQPRAKMKARPNRCSLAKTTSEIFRQNCWNMKENEGKSFDIMYNTSSIQTQE